MPKDKKAPIKELYKKLNSWDSAQQFVADVYTSRYFIIGVCALAFCKISTDHL